MPYEHHFPRWRRLWRGALRASDFVVRFGGVVLMGLAFAFVGAFFSLPTRPDWGDKFVYGLGVAVLALLLVWGLAFVWQSVRYWLSGGQDRDWEMTAAMSGDGVARFTLARKPGAPPGFVHVHETMECFVRTPNGMEIIPDQNLFAPKAMSAQATLQSAEPGHYEVRWYGSRRGMFYEITRGKFILDGSDSHWLTPERTTARQQITRRDRCLDSRGEWGLFGRSGGSQSTSKPGEDGEVSVQLDAPDPTDAEGE